MRRPGLELTRTFLAMLFLAALGTAPTVSAQSGGIAVDFHDARGNDWWVEVETTTSATLARVEARVDEGPWVNLPRTSWGSWAASFYVTPGSLVDFRATSSTGATALSGLYEWPSATLVAPPEASPPPPTTSPPPSGGLLASFTNPRGNNWWVEVEVSASSPLARVEARANAGAWFTLSRTSWGSWATSVFVATGSLVDFRATAQDGSSAVSGRYEWPSANLVTAPPPDEGPPPADDPPADPPPPPPPSGSADVTVRVDVARGPNGAASPVQLEGNVLGTSVADWESYDYMPSFNPTYLAYLKGLRPAYLRWPAGHSSQNYAFVRTPGTSGMREITASHVDAFMALAREVGGEPLIAINVKTQPPSNAADLVRYLNIERGYGVTWFHIGNEPDHLDGLTSSPSQHVARHRAVVDAMKAVDPSIRIVGPEIMTGASALGLHGMTNWMLPVLQQAGSTLDGVSWHWYQLDSGQWNPNSSAYFTLGNLFQESAPDWQPASLDFASTIMPALQSQTATYARGASIWVTEFGEDPGPGAGAGISDTMAGAVWAADAIGRYLDYGAGAILKWVFKQSGVALTFVTGSYEPVPEYLTWWLYTNHFGDEMVRVQSSSKTRVNAHASWRPDGRLAVMFANKSTSAAVVGVDLQGFRPLAATRYVLRGTHDGFDARSATLNGRAMTATRAVSGVPAEAVPSSQLTTFTMAPASVMLVVYE